MSFVDSPIKYLAGPIHIFNERAARRSRSTSRFGCSVSGVPCRVSPEQLEQLEQLQSAITMASVNRIDSNFFV